MKALILTRGFAQQFDYNVIECVKPWGEELHSNAADLQVHTTSPSDYDFSFVVEGTGSGWSMILNCIPSMRRDFAGSPLRTYLYLSGNSEESEFARRILSIAIEDFWPGSFKGADGVLPKCLDSIVTNDVINGFVGWNGVEKIDASRWSEEHLVPALCKVANQGISQSLHGDCIREFFDKVADLLEGSVGVLTGEYRPYLDDPMNDNPNFVFHFSEIDIRTVMPNGAVKLIRKPTTPPFVPHPTPVPPESGFKFRGKIVKIAIVTISAILLVFGLRSCLAAKKVGGGTGGIAVTKVITPQNAATNTPVSVTNTPFSRTR